MEIVICYAKLRRRDTPSLGFKSFGRDSSSQIRSRKDTEKGFPRCQILAKLIVQRMPENLLSSE
jgi:hypothetical protein